MNSREELLNGLNNAVNIIRRLANIQERLNYVRLQYRNIKPLRKFSIIGKIAIVFWTILSIYVYTVSKDIVMLILGLIIWVLPTFLIFSSRKKTKNQRIVEENKESVERNKQLAIQEQRILNELQEVQTLYRNYISSWYPIDYCSVDASEFFYNAINNYRADNLKEAINLYEMTLHQRRIEANQRQAIREQQLSNLLSAQHIAVQQQQVDAISKQTASINNVNDSINRFYRGY